MEIDFNPGRLPKPDVGAIPPVPRREAPQTVSATTLPFQMTTNLESKLNGIPLVRPEVVKRAETLVADIKYPPEEMLKSISVLLAIRMKDNG